jgi:tetratricopeptide (TPR) repeat protein
MADVPRRLARIIGWPCLAVAIASAAEAQPPGDASKALDAAVAAAEANLRNGEHQIAESRYRTALLQGWMLLGSLEASAGDWTAARDAFERASAATIDDRAGQQSVAIADLQIGDAPAALAILSRMAAAAPRDVGIRLALAEALVATGRTAEAVQELDELHGAGPLDPEAAFALGTGYLRLGRAETADALFAQVESARPLAETFVLIGRTYRDLEYYTRARTALERALKLDPHVRRAHYYLGTAALMEEGVVRLDEAIDEFRQELAVAPGDPAATARLGMALVEARREAEALPLLEQAIKTSPGAPEPWAYLGRCQLALHRPADAVASLRHALELAGASTGTANDPERRRMIQYQLGTALRATGAAREAEEAFAEAARLSERRTAGDRDRLAQYLGGSGEPEGESAPRRLVSVDLAAYSSLSPEERNAAASRVRTTLARAYLNLGILQAQAGRFTRAAPLFATAVELDPAFPQAQYSLGVAYFNAQQYGKAIAPLTRAREQQPANADASRMLALSSFQVEDYARAAALLAEDPKLPSDPALQYAYGVALVRSGRAEDAERIFSRLLAQSPDLAELNVVLGQAHAAQGDYDAAVASFRRALELKPGVADANAALGAIALRKGDLEAASSALRAELAGHPDDLRTRNTLATALELQGHHDDAREQLRVILARRPDDADARYLLGKILLAAGNAADAAVELERAAQAAPDDANVHYQLGQAYQRLGNADGAAREFETFQRLKAKSRGEGR